MNGIYKKKFTTIDQVHVFCSELNYFQPKRHKKKCKTRLLFFFMSETLQFTISTFISCYSYGGYASDLVYVLVLPSSHRFHVKPFSSSLVEIFSYGIALVHLLLEFLAFCLVDNINYCVFLASTK